MRRAFDHFVKMDQRRLVRPRNMFYCLDGSCSNQERRDILYNYKRSGGIIFATDLISVGISMRVNSHKC